MKRSLIPIYLGALFAAQQASAVLSVSSPIGDFNTDWIAVTYPGTTSDSPSDEQATDDRSDIVGDANNPAIYKAFYDGGTDSATNATDGEMAFPNSYGWQRK